MIKNAIAPSYGYVEKKNVLLHREFGITITNIRNNYEKSICSVISILRP